MENPLCLRQEGTARFSGILLMKLNSGDASLRLESRCRRSPDRPNARRQKAVNNRRPMGSESPRRMRKAG
jgi:hypothetical protein